MRASKLPYAQGPMTRAEFEKYTLKIAHFIWGDDARVVFQARKSDCEKYLPRAENKLSSLAFREVQL